VSPSGDRFFERVYGLVRNIPRGRVVTYGQVAAMLGVARGARAVGWALRALSEAWAPLVPWHRVGGAGGRISLRAGPGPEIQRRRLRAEGVGFRRGHVDLARHGLQAAAFRRSQRGMAGEGRDRRDRQRSY
jgi:methylated-DNA-protein-cysteine methyltransferase-like protein